MTELRTQVVIVGAGPAGLFLGHLLQQAGIDNVVLERRSREYVERRVRAGVIEHGVANTLDDTGAGERMRREGLLHHGVEFRFDHASHRVALSELTNGKTITVYGQQELVKDLIALRVGSGGELLFDSEASQVSDLNGDRAIVEGTGPQGPFRITADFVAGCDGSLGWLTSPCPRRWCVVTNERTPLPGWVSWPKRPDVGRADLLSPPARFRLVLDAFSDDQSFVPRRRAEREPRRVVR